MTNEEKERQEIKSAEFRTLTTSYENDGFLRVAILIAFVVASLGLLIRG